VLDRHADVVQGRVPEPNLVDHPGGALDNALSRRRTLCGELGQRAANSTDDRPPSTSKTVPWTSVASSLARNTAARAIASGATRRPSGAVAIIGPAISATGLALSKVTPGEIALTRTPVHRTLQPKRG